MADIVDIAEQLQQSMLDAKLQTAHNNAAELDKVIDGSGFCLECGKSVDPVEANFKIKEVWIAKIVNPRWCCPECKIIWERDN